MRKSAPRLSRRDFFTLASVGVVGASRSGWLDAFAAAAASNPQRKRACILLWMNGGPSTIDLWDMKPGHANGGEFREIATTVPGIRISETLPRLAKHMHHLAIVRSMATREGDHGRATYLMRTGNLPMGGVQYPTIGSLVSKELGHEAAELPNYVSISPFRAFNTGAYGPGFLGPRYAPLIVGENVRFAQNPMAGIDSILRVQDVAAPKDLPQSHSLTRMELLHDLESDFAVDRPSPNITGHRLAYERAIKLMAAVGARAFDLNEESPKIRDSYGRTIFGQGCLLARRLIERGVPFVEVNLTAAAGAPAGWDTHAQNFPAVRNLSRDLDNGWAALMTDLAERGLLETTTILWMGEFGRTPKINGQAGRDHFANAWSCVLAGGGIKGGTVYGKTSADGMTVEGPTTSTTDLLATLCAALGIDHLKTNTSNTNRPIRIVDKAAKVIHEVIA